MLGSRVLGAARPFAAPLEEEVRVSMIRSSLPAAVAAAMLAIPAVAVHEEPPVIPANHVGTWRLDSLLDQAKVEGPDPSDVDPSTFVLRDVRFENDVAHTEAIQSPSGEGTVEHVDGALRLHAKGKLAAFVVPIPSTKASEWGMLAVHARSSDTKEVAVFAEAHLKEKVDALFNALRGFAGGGAPPPPQAFFPIAGLPKPAAPPAKDAAAPAAGGAAAPATDGATAPAADGVATPAAAPAAGGAPPPPAPAPPGGGIQVVINGPAGNGGVNALGALDPRQFFGNSIAKFESDGDWHTILRNRREAEMTANAFGGIGNFGQAQRVEDLTAVTILVVVPPEKEKEGVTLDVDFVHVLDGKVEFAKATAATTTLERRGILHQGMYVNTTAALSYALVAPEKARLLAGVTCLTEAPIDLTVAVTCEGKRTQLRAMPVSDPSKIESLDVDLAPFAGKKITLTLEAADQGDPGVLFLLQPIVYGKHKEGVKDVLLYFCDTLRADGLGCYGNQRGTTPNLDQIASEGVRFERCFSQGPWTYVSMPSSLSSLFPSVDGVRTGGEQIPDSCTTMAEAFRDAGYMTCALIRNDFVGRTTHTEQGFDFFYSPAAIGAQAPAALIGLLRAAGQNPDAAGAGGNGNGFNSGSSRDLFTTVEPWLAKYKDIPFFLYLHSVEPHGPYNPPKEELAKFGGEEARTKFLAVDANAMAMTPKGGPNAFANGFPNVNPPAAPAAKPTPVANAADYPAGSVARQFADLGIDPAAHALLGRDLYDASVHYMDAYVEKVVGRMKELGLWDQMVFSFNADHGEEFFDHNNSGHGHSVFAELNHVPWILRAPGVLPAGKVVKDNAMNLDLAPTLLGLVGLAPAESMQGRSLAESLKDDEPFAPTMVVTELWAGGIGGGNNQGDDYQTNFDEDVLGSFSVIEGRWKTIIRRYRKVTPPPPGAVVIGGGIVANIPGLAAPKSETKPPPGEIVTEMEVYDLDADLADAHPVTEQRKEESQQTLKRFLAWVAQMKELRKRYADEKSTSDSAQDALRRLGYAK
jgi:arylsulfatase A-like enzyme